MRKSILLAIPILVLTALNTSAIITVESWYRLGEDGTAEPTYKTPKDSSPFARDLLSPSDGSYTGVTIGTVNPPPGSTHYYVFDGNDTGYSLSSWDPPENNIGVECWVRTSDLEFQVGGVTPIKNVFGTGPLSANGLGIVEDDVGAGFLGRIGASGNWVGTAFQPATTSQWVHVAIVRNSGVATFYVNGVATTGTRTDVPPDATAVHMGYGGSLTNFFGAMDEARIFTFAPGEFHRNDLLFYQSTNNRPYLSAFKGKITGFTAKLQNKGTTVSAVTTVTFNGSNVTASVSQAGGITTVAYTHPVPLPSGSTHTAAITFTDSAAASYTVSDSFTLQAFVAVPASYAVTGVNTALKGFVVRPYQTYEVSDGTLAWTEDQLLGLQGANVAYLEGWGSDGQGNYLLETPINFKNGSGGAGNFTWPNYGDTGFNDVGIGVLAGTEDYGTLEINTFLHFPAAGLYDMGVNSDDGFKVTTGRNPRDRFALVLGQFDGPRGAADTRFKIYIPAAGYYPFRLLYQNTGGGAALEWYTLDEASGTLVLVGDQSLSASIKAYRAGPALPAYVSRIAPAAGATGVLPDSVVEVRITDAGTTVNTADVKMALNENPLATPTTIAKVSGVITATLNPGGLTPTLTYTAKMSFQDSAATQTTNTWQFKAIDASLPIGMRTAPGSGDNSKRGFRVRTYQENYIGTIPNYWAWAEAVLAGVWGTNTANLSGADANGEFAVPLVNLNRYADGTGEAGYFVAPDYPDSAIPGLPGGDGTSYDNVACEVKTFVEFPTAGVYRMGVNGDDSIKVTVGDSTGPDYGTMRILAPPGVALSVGAGQPAVVGQFPAYLTTDFGTRAWPKPDPIVAQAVLCDPLLANAPLNNAGAMQGKIAICQRGAVAFVTKARYCQGAGARAMIVFNNQAGWVHMGGGGATDVNIPLFFINTDLGYNLTNYCTTGANSPLVLSIGDDNSMVLGGYQPDTGNVTFSIYVPAAGLYPLRLLWENGTGGAHFEWWSLDSGGDRILLNDTSKPNALKTYRARTVTGASTLNIAQAGGSVTISWTGTGELQESASVTGPFGKSANQGNPQTRPASPSQKFFRLRVY